MAAHLRPPAVTTPAEPDDTRLFADLARAVLPGRAVSELLDLIIDLSVSSVDGVTDASVSVVHRDGERLDTTNATSAQVRSVDEAQYAGRQGPCVHAIHSGAETTVRIPAPHWPEFSDRAARAGIRSVFSLPLRAERRTIGALNLYSTTEMALADSATGVARALAAQASVVVANATALAVAEMTNQQLRQALETRDLIGQAKGILMGRDGVDADAAFDILRRASQRTNRKVRDIAAEIVEHHLDPDSGP